MSVNYMKVDASNPNVIALAKAAGVPVAVAVSLVNQDRYRKAYQAAKLERDKKVREFFKANPELLKEVK